jgi:hypothetical protein
LLLGWRMNRTGGRRSGCSFRQPPGLSHDRALTCMVLLNVGRACHHAKP